LIESTLIYLINGRKEKFDFPINSIIKKIDEKDLANWKLIKNIYSINKADSIIFATDDLEYQRFIFFMKLYILLTAFNGSIIDENKKIIEFNFMEFIFIDIPKLVFEIFITIITILSFKVIINKIYKEL